MATVDRREWGFVRHSLIEVFRDQLSGFTVLKSENYEELPVKYIWKNLS